MPQRNRFIVQICEYLHLAKLKFLELLGKDQPVCRIEEIDTEKRIIIVHSRGVSAPIKFRFDEIINDTVMLSCLSPEQASWVGYYFGMYYENLLKDKKDFHFHPNNFDFASSNYDARCKLMLQDRLGNIFYLDRLTNLTHKRSVISIITTSGVINNFDSIEACYLGILAGIFISKNDGQKKIKIQEKNYLKLVQ